MLKTIQLEGKVSVFLIGYSYQVCRSTTVVRGSEGSQLAMVSLLVK
jgi:hypothetical protein